MGFAAPIPQLTREAPLASIAIVLRRKRKVSQLKKMSKMLSLSARNRAISSAAKPLSFTVIVSCYL
jgi:hypothetical protein